MAATIFGWLTLASGLVPGWPWLVGMLTFLGGLAGAVFGVASTRIVMGSVPAMGRNHFFALFTVISGIGLGGAPIVWGAILDALGPLNVVVAGLTLDRYTIYFAALFIFAWINIRLVASLHEGAPVDMTMPIATEIRPVAPVE